MEFYHLLKVPIACGAEFFGVEKYPLKLQSTII